MKKIILFLIFSSNLYFCQEVDKDIYAKAGLPTPIDLPPQTELPSVSASIEKADMMMKGYSDSPPKPDFPKFPEWMHKQPPTLKDNSKEIEKITERIRRNTAELEYINKLRRDSLLREINGGDTFQKIIDEQNSKIDVSGGWAKKSDIENSELDVETQSPIEVSISDEHNNNSSNDLTLIFMIFLLLNILLCYFIALKLGKTRKIGFWWCFIAGFCLTPIGGVIVALLTPSIENSNYKVNFSKNTGIERLERDTISIYEKSLNATAKEVGANNDLLGIFVGQVFSELNTRLKSQAKKLSIDYSVSEREVEYIIDKTEKMVFNKNFFYGKEQ